MKFCHLHNHSHFSLLDGCCKIPDMVSETVAQGGTSLALTDHGNISGAIEFYKACIAAKIKPIIGCEMYVAPTELDYKKPIENEPSGGYHLVVLAKNNAGYKNLIKLASIAATEGFYYRPRIDKKTLSEHAEGLIISTACIKGEVNYWTVNDNEQRVINAANQFADMVGKENFYIEVQDHGIPEEDKIRSIIIPFARKNGYNLLATNDIHYVKPEHAFTHDVLVCIQTGKKVKDTDRLKYSTDALYMRTPAQMIDLFRDCPEAIDNTLRIAEQCNVEIELGKLKLPEFVVPKGTNPADWLKMTVTTQAPCRLPAINSEIVDRVKYELKVINEAGFASYFLIVQDFINYAKQNGIPVGPGRGSVAGSLVAYILGITEVNPLQYGLLFERFLNPERVSLPDIDVDFADVDREKVFEYVRNKYGRDNVTQISTFGTMQARAAIKDVGRALDISYQDLDNVSKAIPPKCDLKGALEIPELTHIENTALYKHALVVEGLNRHMSTHASALVIAPSNITDNAPLCMGSHDELITQFDMNSLESLGLLKFDFLGLKTLTVIRDTIRFVGDNLDINTIPLDDPKALQIFQEGDTSGVFQFESSGMRGYLRKLHPENLDDIAAMNALYRPGPLEGGLVDSYILRKHGMEDISYLHPSMEQSLKSTYGVIIYQEQVMNLARDMAGFTLGEADVLRKAMGKKIKELMETQKQKFIDGAVKNKVEAELAAEVFELVETFAGYGFNKCLSGDTLIRRSGANQYDSNPNISIEEVYSRFHSKASVGKKYRKQGLYISGGDSERTKNVKIINVYQNGIKPLIHIKTSSGKQIKITSNHRLMTIDGWKTGSQLTTKDQLQTTNFVYVNTDNTYSFTGQKQLSKGGYSKPTSGFPTGKDNPMYINGSYSAYKKWQDDNSTVMNCQMCGKLHDRLETHHKDNDRDNNTDDNLTKLCPSCHKKEHYEKHGRTKRGKKGYETHFEYITSIEYIGNEMTYDIEVDDESHAFYANGILSHNSHAVAYAMIAYQTAYLKAHHPVEFMTALLISETGDNDRIIELLAECKVMGIAILPPDINESLPTFTPSGKSIRFGINAITNIGDDLAHEISANKPYDSIFDMTSKISSKMYNSRKLTSLIDAGVFDQFGTRKAHKDSLEQANSFGRTIQAYSEFKFIIEPRQPFVAPIDEYDEAELLRNEKAATGFYMSGHPTKKFANRKGVTKLRDIKSGSAEGEVKVICVITRVEKHITKVKKENMAFLTLEDESGTVEALSFPRQYITDHAFLIEGVVAIITGKASNKDERGAKIIIDSVNILEKA